MNAIANLVAFGLTIIFILLLRPLALRLGIVDHPGGRKRHEHSTPLVGGLAFFLGLVISVVIFQIAIPSPIAYFSAATLLVIIGLLDDRFDLPARWRLLAQVAAALIMILGDMVVSDFGDWFGLRFDLGPLAIPFTIFAVVGLINAFNMLDGLDGLAGLVSISLLAVVGLWAKTEGAVEVENLAYLLLFVVGGFLLFNLRLPGRPRASVFMGDAGSMLLGLSFAWMVIALAHGQHRNGTSMAAFWLVAFPILETANVMLRRKLKGRHVYRPDHEHLHYLCQQCGLSINQTVLLLGGLALSLASVGLIAGLLKAPDWLPALALPLAGILYYWVTDHFTRPRERAPAAVEQAVIPSQKIV